MDMEDMFYQEVSCGKFRESNKMNSLRKFVHNGNYDCITLRRWEPSNNVITGDQGPAKYGADLREVGGRPFHGHV